MRTRLRVLSALLISVSGFSSITVAHAVVGDRIFIASQARGATGNQIFQGTPTTLDTATNLTADTAAGRTYRALASDGTYLYFNDNQSGATWDLVRLNLDGTGRTVIASGAGPASQIAPTADALYYTTWSGGIYVVAKTASSTPRQIIAPSSSYSGGTLPGSGFDGLAVDSSILYFTVNNSGLYKVQINSLASGPSVETATVVAARTDTVFKAAGVNVSNLAIDSGRLYIGTTSAGKGIYYSTNPMNDSITATQSNATWTWIDTYQSNKANYAPKLIVVNSKIYFVDGNGGAFSINADGTGAARLDAPGSVANWDASTQFSSSYAIAFVPAPTYTVTYQHGTGATGSDSTTTISQGTGLTLPNPTTFFTAPSGARQNGWQVTTGTSSSSSGYPSTGSVDTPTSNVTYTARWTGGPLQYSTTSFLTTGTSMATINFPNGTIGVNETLTVYVYNSGSLSTSFSNGGVSGSTDLSLTGGTCNTTSTTLTAGAQCTLTLSWTPTGNLTSGKFSEQVTGSYYDEVNLTGTAAANKTVTFNANSGTGTMSNQVASSATNLTANTFSRSGYTFAYWTPDSAGTGTHYTDGSSYGFANNVTMFAQWTQNAAPAPVDPPAPKQTDYIDQVVTTPTNNGIQVCLSGRFLRPVTNIDVNGIMLKVDSWDQGGNFVTFTIPAVSGELNLIVYNGAVPLLLGKTEVLTSPKPSATPIPTPTATTSPKPTETTKPSPTPSKSASTAKKTSGGFVISFAENSAVLSQSALASIARLAKTSIEKSEMTISITGFVRPSKNLAKDKELSTLRALSVETVMREAGINGTYSVVGAGRSSLVGGAGRRVEVKFSFLK